MSFLRLFFCTLLLLPVATSAYTPSEKTPTVVVMADPSLALPLARIAREYTRNKHVVLSLSFQFSGDQAQHIENGDAAGVFITPLPDYLQRLKVKGLIDVYSEEVVATNHLALMGHEHSVLSLDLSGKQQLSEALLALHTEPKLELPNPEMLSSGQLAYKALESKGLLQSMVPMIEQQNSLNDIARAIEQGQRYTISYLTDLPAIKGSKVIAVFDEPVHYYAAVIAGEDMNAARDFLAALKTPASQNILKEHGFGQ